MAKSAKKSAKTAPKSTKPKPATAKPVKAAAKAPNAKAATARTPAAKALAVKQAQAKKPSGNDLHDVRFPNEGAAYRAARNDLLRAEIELRAQVEKVAALRRGLPLGGVIPEDYVFEEGDESIDDTSIVHQVKMSELFEDKPTLVAYSYMYGPQMEKPCPSCTSILDGLDGEAEHIDQRVSFVVIAKSPIARLRKFARESDWGRLRLLSSADNSYNRDYHGETADGRQMPSLNVFVRRNGKIHHFFHTELLFSDKVPGMDHRHVDMIWPLWNLFDFTPEGRGKDWYPKLSYGQ